MAGADAFLGRSTDAARLSQYIVLIVTSVLVTVALTILTFYDDKHNVRRRQSLHLVTARLLTSCRHSPQGWSLAQMASNLENAWYAEYEANPNSPILESLAMDVRPKRCC